MRKRLLSLVVVLVMVTAVSMPAIAGGWAAVHPNGEIPPAYQEVPWTLNFLVKQHDKTPVNVDHTFLSATHRATGETVTADAVQVGDVGNYTVTAIFPLAGDWKWSITPEPFGGTSFATLTVLAGATATLNGEPLPSHPAHIHSGTCATLGDVVFPLANVQSNASATPTADTASKSISVSSSETTIETTMASLQEGDRAINIHKSDTDIGTYIACGNIPKEPTGGMLVIMLTPLNNSGATGVAILMEAGARTLVTVMVFESGAAAATATPVAATSPTVEVLAIGDSEASWQFTPTRLEITTGTTVVWSNVSTVYHTISAPNLAFEDSGYVDPGQSFQQTFDTPGTYSFHCDPHPWMMGVIEVS